jgi:DNA-binding MarR family transcriptional regulator
MQMAKGPRTIYLIKRLETLIRLRLEAALQDVTLTPGQYTTLSVVNVGPVSSADLARRVGITPQSMSEVISTLERKGLITRTVRGDNRRIADVALTALGETVLREAEERVDVVERDLFREVSPQEVSILRETLEVILS